ncbi:MAG: ATP-binding cassette domain-containing protein, partial [Rhodoferax sp.]|nr:ATP-binding cassette domain-containing protein [Rhodoferax sp.]
EQQMLAIARALLSNPRLLVLDEPTEGLAPVIVEKIGQTIALLQQRGFTILMVEQNFRFASHVADRFYVVEEGRVVSQFARDAITTDRARIESLLGI